MEKICENCKFWERIKDEEVFYTQCGKRQGFGKCKSGKIAYGKNIDSEEDYFDGILYWDYECYAAECDTGKDFGCIHWKKKSVKF